MKSKFNLRKIMKKIINYNSLRNLLICFLAFSLILWIMSSTLTFFHNNETIEDIRPGMVFCGGDYVKGDYVVFEKEYYDNVAVRYVDGVPQEPEYENYYVEQHIGKVSSLEVAGTVQLETYSVSRNSPDLAFSGLYDAEEDMVCGKIYWNVDSVLFHVILFLCVSILCLAFLRIIKR